MDLVEEQLRNSKTIAVVGLSDNPERISYGVSRYMQEQGYRIIPVNPMIEEALGEKSYPDLKSVPVPIDMVDVFRRSELVLLWPERPSLIMPTNLRFRYRRRVGARARVTSVSSRSPKASALWNHGPKRSRFCGTITGSPARQKSRTPTR